MNKIVNLKDRIENEKQKRRLELYRRKMEVIQSFAQCSTCHFRCAMCGQHLTETEASNWRGSPEHGYAFCDACGGEFEDYLSMSRHNIRTGPFWHNTEWKEMWSAWLQYQEAMTEFLNSPEYKLLLEEFDPED